MVATSVRVSVPATSANLGPGFDSIGVALGLRGELELTITDATTAPTDVGEQMAIAAAERVFHELGRPAPQLRARLSGNVPVGRGLGASAIVHVGAVLAASTLAKAGFDQEQMLRLAAELEGHADNSTPALLGGLQVVVYDDWDQGRLSHVRVPLPEGLSAVLFVPDFEMPTHESRQLLPKSLSRQDAVFNIGRAAMLVASLAAGQLDELRWATEDRLHQPARSKLFPGMYNIIDAALAAGALAAYLSGGGSTLLALSQGNEERIASAMAEAAAKEGTFGRTLVTSLSEQGAEIVNRQ